MRPAALRVRLPEIEAVGVPSLLFKKAKLAEVEAWPPKKTSTVEFLG